MEAQTDQNDIVVAIPKNREKFFGRSGKMLLPSRASVEMLIAQIPENQVITVDRLEKTLAAQFEADVSCPVTTKKALAAIATDPVKTVAYWRVIRKNGQLYAKFPGGVEGHAAHLRSEGFEVDNSGKAPKVKNFADRVVKFD